MLCPLLCPSLHGKKTHNSQYNRNSKNQGNIRGEGDKMRRKDHNQSTSTSMVIHKQCRLHLTSEERKRQEVKCDTAYGWLGKKKGTAE
jgi:hypothetical protein